MAAAKGKRVKKGRQFLAEKNTNRKRKKKELAYLHGDVKIPPSVHGRLSEQISGIGIALFLIALAVSYLTGGEAGAIIGALGLIDIMFCCLGIFQGLVGYTEKKRDPAPAKRGIAINTILLVFLVLLFFGGLRS
ncbi:MAG: hypothetical protein II787_02445 [Lachnospiraceae bacterium]|nr:hypothetical protein [Lachnospiraceae bacterium]